MFLHFFSFLGRVVGLLGQQQPPLLWCLHPCAARGHIMDSFPHPCASGVPHCLPTHPLPSEAPPWLKKNQSYWEVVHPADFHPSQADTWVLSTILMEFGYNHHSLLSEYFQHPLKKLYPVSSHFPTLPTTCLLSVSMNLSIPSTQYQQNHRVWGPLPLAAVTQHHICKVQSRAVIITIPVPVAK